MPRPLRPLLLALSLGALTPAQAERTLVIAPEAPATEKRVALVIGNSAYVQSPLRNTLNDAVAMAEKLRALGFEVIEKHDLTQKQIGRALGEFRSRLSPGDAALFFYAGHGVQVGGVNYLPAVDADIGMEEDVPTQSIDVNRVLEVMEKSKTRVNLVFLDACRNNPYSRSFRSAGEGLARIAAPSGSLIFYATRPGSVAEDGEGQNGLYTHNLLASMDLPGLTVEQIQKRVAAEVKQASRGRQEPWMEGLLDGEFYFRQGGANAAPLARNDAAPPPVPLAPSEASEEVAYWSEVSKSDQAKAYDAYLRLYPNGRYVAQARSRLQREQQNVDARLRLKEDLAWQDAQNGNDFSSFKSYLALYPEGRYAAQAKLKLSRLTPPVKEPEMAAIPGRNYEMGKYEVTQAEWVSVMKVNPSTFRGEELPVEKVSWQEVQEYIRRLNQITGKNYRLPTEEEWKHACYGGNEQEYCGGSHLSSLAWHQDNAYSQTHRVGQKQANGYGLHDMSGNVWEWVQDCYGNCDHRIVHGGSWYLGAAEARVAARYWYDPNYSYNDVGFRLARTLP
ncbi:MAG: SUMF1/EgtB/PvdO family nonheme iron enzyme [Betaproteobacteria bacterium]|nr:SUMF1/EgtB/PvdO family nonheme iron enzyme [Betaproteobacteria bacterium]